MFGVSFLEAALIGLVALIVVGPEKLPELMRTAGEWLGRLRRLTADMRRQTGIDDILREEGIDGVGELRTLLRGERGLVQRGLNRSSAKYETYSEPPDLTVEFPSEGADAKGALPDDLLVAPILSEPAADPPSTTDSPREPEQSTDKKPPSFVPPSIQSPQIRESVPAPSASATETPMTKNHGSIPPPPATPRRIPPRAITHPETPKSKSEPKIVISEPPPPAPRPSPTSDSSD